MLLLNQFQPASKLSYLGEGLASLAQIGELARRLIQFQGRLPTGLDWTGLAWPAGMVILQMTNGYFAGESRNGLWESLVLPTSSS